GSAANGTITNLAIVAGQDKGFESHGIAVRGSVTSTGLSVDNCSITTEGLNGSVARGFDSFASKVYFLNCTLTNNTTAIVSRDAFHGSVMHTLQGVCADNTITNSPHGGYIAGTSSSTAYKLLYIRNTNQQKGRY